jgi:hypothetical protein
MALDPAALAEERPDVHARRRQAQPRPDNVPGQPAVRVQPRWHLLVAYPGGERQEGGRSDACLVGGAYDRPQAESRGAPLEAQRPREAAEQRRLEHGGPRVPVFLQRLRFHIGEGLV